MPDYTARLHQIPLFASLGEADLADLNEAVKVRSYRGGDTIVKQGEPGDEFYIIDSGQVRIVRQDASGVSTVIRYDTPGQFFGEASLLYDEPRNATVEAVTDTTVFAIPKEAFHAMVDRFPHVRRVLREAAGRHHAPLTRFAWQEPDEVAVWVTKRNVVPLIVESAVGLAVNFAIAGGLVLLGFYLESRDPSDPWFWILLAAAILWVAFTLVWYIVDWTNDYLVVTNRRIVHVERYGLIAETREEVPIAAVQSVVLSRGDPLDAALGLSAITVETIGGRLKFTHIPSVRHLQERILDQITRVQQEAQRQEREAIREELLKVLPQAQVQPAEEPDSEEEPPAPPAPPAPPVVQPPQRKRRPLVLLPTRLERPGEVTWRKHWLILVSRLLAPAAVFLLGLALTLVLLVSPWLSNRVPDVSSVSRLAPFLPLLLVPIALVWGWWRYMVWAGDVYTVTTNRIVDLNRLPFGVRETRRESTLEKIQNIDVVIRNLVGRLFDMGDVIIKTGAGTDDFVFHSIAHPHSVQRELFHRLAEFRRKSQEGQRRQRYEEMAKWLAVYNELTHVPAPAPLDESQEEQEEWEF